MRFVRLSIVFWLAAVGGVAVGLYQLKYEVQHLEERLSEVRQQIRADRSALHVLEAEWNRMNRPDRLAGLAEEHLDMRPTQPAQIATVSQLPPRVTRELVPADARGEVPRLDGIPVPLVKPWSLDRRGGQIARGPAPARDAGRPADAAGATPTAARPAQPAAVDTAPGAAVTTEAVPDAAAPDPAEAVPAARSAESKPRPNAAGNAGTGRSVQIGHVRIELGSAQ